MKYFTSSFNLWKLHQMKKKYTRLNHKIYYTTFLIKKITPNWEKNTTNAIMKYFTPHFYCKKAIPYSEKITRKTKNFTPNNKSFKPNLFFSSKHRSSHPEVFLEKGVLKICSKFTEWVFSCKVAAYFQNSFYQEHLWAAAFVL